MVGVVRDVQIAARIHRDTRWDAEVRICRRPAIAREAKDAVTRHRGDDPRRRSDLANSLVAKVRDVEIPACIQRDAVRVAEARARRRTAVAGEGVNTIARHRRDDPCCRGNLANSVVGVLRDVEIAARIQRDTGWAIEARLCRGTAIAREAKDAVTRHRGDDPRRRSDLANSLVAKVRDVEIAA